MRKTVLALTMVALLAFSGRALAVIGTIDQVPAATLLLPYFEVNLADPNGITTLFSINNATRRRFWRTSSCGGTCRCRCWTSTCT